MKIIELNMQHLLTLCQRYHVRSLQAFGSVLTPRFTDRSDVDLLVEFKKEEISDYFTNYYELKEALHDLFAREIDLVEASTIRNKYLSQSIESNHFVIYG